MKKLCILACLLVPLLTFSQKKAADILNKALQYHDPDGLWSKLDATFEFIEKQPDGSERNTTVKINNQTSSYYINRGDQEAYQVEGEQVSVLKGSKDAARGLMFRNYYTYLWGLPMKLQDPGTSLVLAADTTVQEVPCHVIKVVYEQDTWTYYFDQRTFQMIAYRFIKNDGSGSGENIYLRGEIQVGRMKIPQERSWYTIPDNTFLGTDKLVKVIQ